MSRISSHIYEQEEKMINTIKLDMALNRVEKPGRYIGMEVGSVFKDPGEVDVSFAFAFPDVYEIGMSYTGLDIIYTLINSVKNYVCERVFAPWTDMEKEHRELGLPLYTLESKRPVSEFDILGFTLQYEMSYTNILNMLELSGIPLLASERDESFPLVAAGGPCAYNPEPMADFIDLFCIGEGEELLLDLFSLYEKHKRAGYDKKKFLEEASQIHGIYVPSLYEVNYDENGLISSRTLVYESAPEVIEKRYIRDLNDMHSPKRQLIPNIEVVHDRVVSEIFRGCTQGCRFCQAGMIYRPVREKSVETVLLEIENRLKTSGHDEVSLSSLSTCDYPKLRELVESILDLYESDSVSISLPSLRLDSDSLDVLSLVEKVRKTGLTFAPEAGTQRLRDVINKGISDADIDRGIGYAFREGYSGIKLYFMMGLPTESEQDIKGISDMAYRIVQMFFSQDKSQMKGNLRITVSVSCFVPKPFTPFQWCSQDSLEDLNEKAQLLRKNIKHKKITLNYHDPKLSRMEAAISRGDRRVGAAILRAFEMGAVFDGWRDYFNYELWEDAFKASNLDVDFYTTRERTIEEVLPWDFIDCGVSKDFLKREYDKAMNGRMTPDCRELCHGCGVNTKFPGGYCPC